jgi:hypothetical protein
MLVSLIGGEVEVSAESLEEARESFNRTEALFYLFRDYYSPAECSAIQKMFNRVTEKFEMLEAAI